MVLNNNIDQTQQIIQQYQLHYRVIQDQNIRILLKRIIEDEQLHLQIFQYFLNQFLRNNNIIAFFPEFLDYTANN